MNVDRYITDEVLEAVGQRRIAEHALRAALPGILARHRADVLREAATWIYGLAEDGGWTPDDVAQELGSWARQADEAVAE